MKLYKLPVPMKVEHKGLYIIIKPKLAHGPNPVHGSDGPPLLITAMVIGLTGNEGNVLGHTLLQPWFPLQLGGGYWNLKHEKHHCGPSWKGRTDLSIFSFLVVSNSCIMFFVYANSFITSTDPLITVTSSPNPSPDSNTTLVKGKMSAICS